MISLWEYVREYVRHVVQITLFSPKGTPSSQMSSKTKLQVLMILSMNKGFPQNAEVACNNEYCSITSHKRQYSSIPAERFNNTTTFITCLQLKVKNVYWKTYRILNSIITRYFTGTSSRKSTTSLKRGYSWPTWAQKCRQNGINWCYFIRAFRVTAQPIQLYGP